MKNIRSFAGIFILLFIILGRLEPLTGDTIFIFRLLKGLCAFIPAGIFMLEYLKNKKKFDESKSEENEDEDKVNKSKNLFLAGILFIIGLWSIGSIGMDLSTGPMQVVLTDCDIDKKVYDSDTYGIANYYLTGYDKDKNYYRFALDDDDIFKINIDNDIEIIYYQNINRIKYLKDLE